jgi:hypothetical protein
VRCTNGKAIATLASTPAQLNFWLFGCVNLMDNCSYQQIAQNTKSAEIV